jgi:hypothetical protein
MTSRRVACLVDIAIKGDVRYSIGLVAQYISNEETAGNVSGERVALDCSPNYRLGYL